MPPTAGKDATVTSMPRLADPRTRRSSLPDMSSAAAVAAAAAAASGKGSPGEKKVPTGPKANRLYKSRLCQNFSTTGSCPYHEKCQFAHGLEELQRWEAWRSAHPVSLDEHQQRPHPHHPQQQHQQQHQQHPHHQQQQLPQHMLHGSPDNGRMRSQSDESGTTHSFLDIGEGFGSPKLQPSVILGGDFSLWNGPAEPQTRSRRSSTIDSTYDNIDQLKDAPTLFASPPFF